jgi:hypothetical protein
MAVSGFLVQVEKVTDEEMEQWKRDYPQAFARKVDYAAGVCLEGWMVGDARKESEKTDDKIETERTMFIGHAPIKQNKQKENELHG